MRRVAFLLMVLSGLLASCVGYKGPLPHSLFFLKGLEENTQVWRLDRDGITLKQVTTVKGGVDGFAVSPVNGLIAYTTNNSLYLMDGNGENLRLIADGSKDEVYTVDYYLSNHVGSPLFSPDGRTLAYAHNGLHFYNLATGEDRNVLTNLGSLMGEPSVVDKQLYGPGSWSPDGSQMLVTMSYVEGFWLAVLEPEAEQPFRRLLSEGMVCCQYSWAPDSHSILIGNPHYSMDLPGLWRYDARSGEPTVVISGLDQEGYFSNFVGWPQQLSSGDLVFFLAHFEHFSLDEGIPLVMSRSASDGSNVVAERPEKFTVYEALWAQDGSLAVISGTCCGNKNTWQLILARRDSSPLIMLIDNADYANELMWGP